MEYVIKVNDKEYGPVTEDVLREWVEDGRVLADTEVRNSMMRVWKYARELAFLDSAFEVQSKKFSIGTNTHYVADRATQVLEVRRSSAMSDKIESKNQDQSSAFKNKSLPDRATIALRVKAGIIDLAVIAVIFLLSFILGTYLIANNRISPNFAAYFSFGLWIFLTLLYFGSAIGVFRQTLGMWYYGIMLTMDGDDAAEVYLLRAYIYALLILIIGIFSPLSNFVGGKKRALHDFLTGTQVIKISAKKGG